MPSEPCAAWSPEPGELITDPVRDAVGRVVGRDGHAVVVEPLDGGQPWHTTTFRPADANDRLRARVAVLNWERRGGWSRMQGTRWGA